MKDKLISNLAFILLISILADYCIGVVHSFKKHGKNDAILGMVVFPWAMYRGLEFWWHDDFLDVDWDSRLSTDMQTCVYFVAKANDKTANRFKLNQDLEDFSRKINSYPTDKRQFLIEGTRKYIRYSQSILNDILNCVEQSIQKKSFIFLAGDETKKLEIELSKFKLKNEIDTKSLLDEFNRQLKQRLQGVETSVISESKLKEMQLTLETSKEFQRRGFENVFIYLFKEDL